MHDHLCKEKDVDIALGQCKGWINKSKLESKRWKSIMIDESLNNQYVYKRLNESEKKRYSKEVELRALNDEIVFATRYIKEP